MSRKPVWLSDRNKPATTPNRGTQKKSGVRTPTPPETFVYVPKPGGQRVWLPVIRRERAARDSTHRDQPTFPPFGPPDSEVTKLMDRTLYSLPAGWQNFSTAALSGRLDEIATLAASLGDNTAEFNIDTPGGDDAPSGIDVAESLADARDEIKGELTRRETEAEETAGRRADALARLSDPEPEPETEEDEAPAEPEAAVLSDSQPEPTPTDAPAPAEVVPAAEAAQAAGSTTPEPAEVVLAADEVNGDVQDDGATPDPEPAAVEPQRSARQAAASMNARRGAAEMPRTNTETVNGRMRAAGEQGPNGWREGNVFEDEDHMVEVFTDRINRNFRGAWQGDRVEVPFLQSQFAFDQDRMLNGSDIEWNSTVFAGAESDYTGEQEALVASGGACAPLSPSYEFIECYSLQRPVEAGLPVVGAPRGGIRFLQTVPLGGEAAAGITVKDAATSAILPGNAGYVPKDCTRVSCPTETEVKVASISKCVIFDNLNFRVFPEQVRNMIKRQGIEYAKRKEQFYLDRLAGFAGTAIDINAAQANPMGAGRSIYRDLTTAAHNYRKRNNMSRDQILDVWLPTVVEEHLAVDMVSDPDLSAVGSIVAGPQGNLTQVLAQRARLNVMFYYYDATIAGWNNSAHDGDTTAWRPLPSVFESIMYAPGSVVRINGGSLDLGVVRDSTLNESNDLQMWSEEFIEVAHPGCEVVRHTHTACPSGVGPLAVTDPGC